jgi:hypothetical protein
MLKGRTGVDNLTLRWTSPRLGGELELEVHNWLAEHPRSLVIIDVLAKVRPEGSAKGQNAYDGDYDALSGIHKVSQANPGSSILIVTHDRKAGSDDWMTRVTGTRGVTGAADFVIYIARKRGEDVGTFYVSGRDVEDGEVHARFDVTGWTPADIRIIMETKHPSRRLIWQWLEENGPAWQTDIAEALDLPYPTVKSQITKMADAGEVYSLPDRLGYRAKVGGDDSDDADE